QAARLATRVNDLSQRAETHQTEAVAQAARAEAALVQKAETERRLSDLETRLAFVLQDLDRARRETERAYLAQGDLHKAYRSSTSWRLTAPIRLVGRAGRAVLGLPVATIAAIRFGGGIRPTLSKGLRVLRQEGMEGVRLRLRIARQSGPTTRRPTEVPSGAAKLAPPPPSETHPATPTSAPAAASPTSLDQPPRFTSTTSKVAAPSLAPDYIGQLLSVSARDPAAGSAYIEKSSQPHDLSAAPVKAIAFYLPQFHPIPENDAWWGKGFTEWTNVSKAMPQFLGHHQPHLPGELGFYDLRLVDVQRQQAELARHYGIHGFCFHHYWFGGRRLLERPFNQLLANPDIDLPFCLSWANENWTRRWDGNEQDVLMGQNYSPEDDLAFIADIAPALRDPRYIRFNGRPLLMVYRADQLPNARATAERWRDYCRHEGIGDLYLMAGRTFGITDPRPYGFDAAVEFPPHNARRVTITDLVRLANPDFQGVVYDYNAMAEGFTEVSQDYPILKTVSPGWDNEARKPGKGHIFHGANPQNFGAWVARARAQTLEAMRRRSDQPPFVFINAWNEWAEGAHLEPDRHFGYGFLEATARALAGSELPAPRLTTDRQRIVVVSHDAHPHGAQMLSINLCRTLGTTFGMKVDCVLLEGGPLRDQFAEVAQLHDLSGLAKDGPEAQRLAAELRRNVIDVALCNTVVSGLFARTLAAAGIRVVSLVHELSGLIEAYGLQPQVAAVAEVSEKVVCAAPLVGDTFLRLSGMAADRLILRPQGSYKRSRLRSDFGPASATGREMRARLGLSPETQIVLGVGYADARKGFDLFLGAAERIGQAGVCVFQWVGHHEEGLLHRERSRISRLQAEGKLVLEGLQDDTDPYYAAADLFLLTSREDPYPTVVLEALDVGLPVVGIAGATGSCDLIEATGGMLVDRADGTALADGALAALQRETIAMRKARAASFWQRDDLSFQAYVHDLLDLLGRGPKRVSAVVPNYNYARFLPARIDSILNQTHPVSELVILDDASTDDSRAVIADMQARIDIPVRVIMNEANSGSVFRQWLRGAEAARYDHLWIAEADDLAEPEFLATVMRGFEQDHVVLSYTQSNGMPWSPRCAPIWTRSPLSGSPGTGASMYGCSRPEAVPLRPDR
ncbi:MAG: glycoside hydrolase family 99-like domain-containing protein, partial [Hyphomonas sp.]|nr:glycoside hydrolase family 99-like domain-containing protein [Hyphomonas sp.]